jgi:protein-histidine pros-kinase
VRYGHSARIRLIAQPNAVRIEVRDQGPGVAPEELTKVLAPFYRVDASRSRRHGGVGLGLSIADEIARRHGGQLLLENAPTGGLIATLVLPC